jgi:hypothetical protein
VHPTDSTVEFSYTECFAIRITARRHFGFERFGLTLTFKCLIDHNSAADTEVAGEMVAREAEEAELEAEAVLTKVVEVVAGAHP